MKHKILFFLILSILQKNAQCCWRAHLQEDERTRQEQHEKLSSEQRIEKLRNTYLQSRLQLIKNAFDQYLEKEKSENKKDARVFPIILSSIFADYLDTHALQWQSSPSQQIKLDIPTLCVSREALDANHLVMDNLTGVAIIDLAQKKIKKIDIEPRPYSHLGVIKKLNKRIFFVGFENEEIFKCDTDGNILERFNKSSDKVTHLSALETLDHELLLVGSHKQNSEKNARITLWNHVIPKKLATIYNTLPLSIVRLNNQQFIVSFKRGFRIMRYAKKEKKIEVEKTVRREPFMKHSFESCVVVDQNNIISGGKNGIRKFDLKTGESKAFNVWPHAIALMMKKLNEQQCVVFFENNNKDFFDRYYATIFDMQSGERVKNCAIKYGTTIGCGGYNGRGLCVMTENAFVAEDIVIADNGGFESCLSIWSPQTAKDEKAKVEEIIETPSASQQQSQKPLSVIALLNRDAKTQVEGIK